MCVNAKMAKYYNCISDYHPRKVNMVADTLKSKDFSRYECHISYEVGQYSVGNLYG